MFDLDVCSRSTLFSCEQEVSQRAAWVFPLCFSTDTEWRVVILTYRSCAIDDGSHSGQRSGVAFQTLVGALGSKVKEGNKRSWADLVYNCVQFIRLEFELNTLTKSAETAVVMREYGPLTNPPHTSSMPGTHSHGVTERSHPRPLTQYSPSCWKYIWPFDKCMVLQLGAASRTAAALLPWCQSVLSYWYCSSSPSPCRCGEVMSCSPVWLIRASSGRRWCSLTLINQWAWDQWSQVIMGPLSSGPTHSSCTHRGMFAGVLVCLLI